MEIVAVQQQYTDYLRDFDKRVSKNLDKIYIRPYLGALVTIGQLKYFAPLTSQSKGKSLAENPKKESITFYPIDDCRLGGINLNNMIPLVDGVYEKYELAKVLNKVQRQLHEKQIIDLRKNAAHIVAKAEKIYKLKIGRKLYPNYDDVTCDFKKLETAAKLYNSKKKLNSAPKKRRSNS